MSEPPPIPGYELLRLHGSNGHLTYLARQSSSGRLVHLKVVHSSGKFARMVADSLREQAMLLATLEHPNILRSIEVNDARGNGFFSALEYAEGGCLYDKICTGPMSSTEAVSIARGIASALQCARGRDIVPFDLNPTSIFFTTDNVPKLTDFRRASAGCWDKPGVRCFTLPYTAPEEILDLKGPRPTPRTDVYRVGAVLYAMLAGQAPFSQTGACEETIRQVLERLPAPVRPRNPSVSAYLEAVCMKCLEKQPAHRYAESGDLVKVLGKLSAGGLRTFSWAWHLRRGLGILMRRCRGPSPRSGR